MSHLLNLRIALRSPSGDARFTLAIVVALFLTSLQAQTAKQFIKAGDKAFLTGDYAAALQHYQSAWVFDTAQMDVVYRLAETARMYYQYELAEKYYMRVFFSSSRADFPLAKYYWAQVMKSRGDYEAASRLFSQFVEDNPPGVHDFVALAAEEVNTCRWALDLRMPSYRDQVVNLGKSINSPYSEFGALSRGDTLYYSSYRFEYKKDDHQPRRIYTKIMTSVRGGRGAPLKKPFNGDGIHTAHTALTPDGRRMYFTECRYIEGTRIQCRLFYRDLDKRNRWGDAVPLSINQEGATQTHPSLATDTLCGCQWLYFASDRPGGSGKLDLWRSRINGNSFEEPENIAALNTPENDMTPFFHIPTKRLFFSSDGRRSLGGMDIYSAQWQEGAWSEPENPGFPLNSSYNDLYFALDDAGNNGFFSSNRPGSQFLDPKHKNCCYDIYRITYIPESIPEPVVSVPDTVTLVTSTPIPISLPEVPVSERTPETLEDFLPLALFFDNDEPDKRTTRTTTTKSYEQTFLPYYDAKQTFIDQFTAPLDAEAAEDATTALEDFFESQVLKGYRHLQLFSTLLIKRLEKGDTVEIFIKGFTSPRAAARYNESLASRRIESVKNHFRTWENSALSAYIRSGRLILSEKPFGEITAAKDISDDLNDRRNSVYSVRASRERRVEIVELRVAEKE